MTQRRFPFRPVPAFTPYLVVSIVYLVGILTEADALTTALKPLLVPALMVGLVLLLIGRRSTGQAVPSLAVTILLFAGLTFSFIGDLFLDRIFEIGLGCFLVAHLCYIVMFWVGFRRRMSWWGLLALPWYAGLLWLLAPSLGALLPAVALYGAVLGFMAVSATRGNLLTILGGVFFVISDSMLAFRMFTPLFETPPEIAFIMLAYVLAQGIIVLGVLAGVAPRLAPWQSPSSSESAPDTSKTPKTPASRSRG